MPDYSGIIHTIETAVYGRDMRRAIANGFRLCQSNEGGGSVTVDTTLTVSGQAADSKTVGDKFTDLKARFPQLVLVFPELRRMLFWLILQSRSRFIRVLKMLIRLSITCGISLSIPSLSISIL